MSEGRARAAPHSGALAAFQFLAPDMQLALVDFARLLPSIPAAAAKRLLDDAEREAGVR